MQFALPIEVGVNSEAWTGSRTHFDLSDIVSDVSMDSTGFDRRELRSTLLPNVPYHPFWFRR